MATSEMIQTVWYEEKYYLAGSGMKIPFLVFPSSTQELLSGIERYISLHPIFQKGDKINPFSIIFFLKEKPAPSDQNLWSFTEKAIFNFNVSLEIPPEAVEDYLQPVFIQKAVIEITDGKNHVFATGTATDTLNPHCTLTGEVGKNDLEQLLLLIKKEPNDFHIKTNIQFQGPEEEKHIESQYPLRNLFQITNAVAPTDHIEIRYFDKKDGTYKSVPDKVSFFQNTRKPRAAEAVKLIGRPSSASTINSSLKPNVHLAAHHVINSHISFHNQGLYQIDDIQLPLRPESRPRSLPIVDKPESTVWKDRRTKNKFWYAPEYKVSIPSQAVEPDKSPFLFTFKKVGTDAMGNPVLEGEVQLTLQTAPPAEAQSEGGSKTFKQLSTLAESYRMEIPFTTTEGRQSVSEIPAETSEETGDGIRITFRLTNQWIRACYAAFSTNSAKPPKILIEYTFSGYREIKKLQIKPESGYKISKIPVVAQNASLPAAMSYFKADKKQLVMRAGQEIAFTDSEGKEKSGILATTINRPVFNNPSLLPHINEALLDVLKRKEYAVQTFGKKEKIEVEFSCEEFGQFYLQKEGDTTETIGCRQPYKLGEVDFKLYTPIPELDDEDYKVYKSTQSPNRFLIVPERYVITRFSWEEDNAYQPCLHLYSTLDMVDPQNNKCLLDCTLQPGIPEYKMQELEFKLKEFTSYIPIVEFPSQTDAEVKFNWSVASGVISEINSFTLDKFIRASIAAPVGSILVLQSMIKESGLQGQVIFELADGSSYKSSLQISLGSISGPFGSGPVEISLHGNKLRIENKIESNITIPRLSFPEDSGFNHQQVGRNIAAGEMLEVDLSSEGEPIVHYVVENNISVIEETRNYMEDIECQLIFSTSIDFSKKNIDAIEIEYKLAKDNSEVHNTKLSSSENVREEVLIMLLTDFLSERNIQFRTTVRFTDNSSPVTKDWEEWDIGTNGNIINFTSRMIL